LQSIWRKALAALAAGLWTAQAASGGTLTIRIENVSPRGGTLQVAVYDAASYGGHDQTPVAKIVADARAPETIAHIPNLSPGTYAVKLFQDYGRTGEFAINVLGIPQEPFGFSNDARPLLDQPSFDRAKFAVPAAGAAITVHLQSL
jgi:uncharacterized protein (DUF2141 family)